jgi:hypothetical protein
VKTSNTTFIIIKVVNETVLRNVCLRYFIHMLLQHVSAYLMAILRRIVQIIQRGYYSYSGSVVFSTKFNYVCKLLAAIAVVFVYIKI